MLAATVALIVSVSLLVTVPFAGGPGPAPLMDPTSVREVCGSTTVIGESATTAGLRRDLRIEVGDPRIDGIARQVLAVEDAPEAGLQRSPGVMRLKNDWGTWEGAVSGARYPDSTVIEYGWLTGSGAYEGFTYFYSTHGIPTGTERVVEGAIWPGERPPDA